MIQASELRVGNYLKSDVVVKIDARTIFDIWDISKKYEPIPITEEWLFKFGFVDGHKCEEYHNFIILDPFFIVAYKKNNYHLHVYGKFNIEIKYIHQLQNLYFALTGKELELLNLNQ